ncbi:MAG: hypothetical protein RL156_117 [Bacteroidota bacterium]|jgi:hypothetical protein
MILQHVECIALQPLFVEKFTCPFGWERAMLGALGYEIRAGIGDLHKVV